MRPFVLGLVVLAIAGCSSSHETPTGVKTPPTASSLDTLLTNASIPASGGTLTVNKPGDALNGLTMTVSSGAYASGLTVSLASSSNASIPTTNGIAPISPVVHVTSGGGYANGSIAIQVPVTVPANTFPVVVWYDSATNAMEPMTTIAYNGTSVTAVTGHLENAQLVTPSAARVLGRTRLMDHAASTNGLTITFGVFAIQASVLAQDWDTGFRPGTNDWEMPPYATEATGSTLTLLGVATTELWYFNTKASSTPLNNQFSIVKNAPLSDRIGYRWTSVVENQVQSQFKAFATSAYNEISRSGAVQDTLQFNLIRANFAIAARNGGTPLPVLVDLQNNSTYYYVIAYKASGNKISVADPTNPGDATRFLELGTDGMNAYINPAFQSGAPFSDPLAMSLADAIPLAPLATSYMAAAAGTVGNDVFPAAGFYSWTGQVYDTMYVVDSLRFWAQCGQCQYGYATTLSPAPSGNVASSFKLYVMQGGLVSDSLGSLAVNGFLVNTTNPAPGTQTTLGVPLASATTANAAGGTQGRWLDWQQVTIANLQVTIGPNALEIPINTPQTLQVSVTPNLLPANVSYKWNFGDSTAQVTVQNSPSVQHSYQAAGTLQTTVQIVDNRNNQVIATGNTAVKVDGSTEVWQITSLTYLYTLENGVQMQASDSGVLKDSLPLVIKPNTVPTLVAVNGPPFANSPYYPAITGVAFVSPTDSAQQWAQFPPIPLALGSAYSPFTIFGYTNTGTATQGTITGQALEPNSQGVQNIGYSVNLTKNGSTLSGYINLQGTGVIKGVTTMVVVVDSVVAVRVQ